MAPILLLLVLTFLNAAFASAEIAVLSMNEAKLKKLAEEGNGRAVKLVELTRQPARFLATIQVAITLAGLLSSAFAAENFAGPLAQLLVKGGIPVPEPVLRTVSLVVITLLLAYFNLVFGELVPKRVAMKKSESMALGMANILHVVSRVFAPIVWLLTVSTNGILRLLGLDPNENEERVSEEEIRMLLRTGNRQGTIPPDETEMIRKVFEFDDISVEEICTHRIDVISLNAAASLQEWENIIHTSRHTHYPVFGVTPEDVIGVLDTKDYFRMREKSRERVLAEAVDPPCFIPETMRANVLFRQMKETRRYFAVIIDEYGGLSGIITLHDLMEALVGDLDDSEEPPHPQELTRVGDQEWCIYGSTSLDEVAEALQMSLPVEEYDTFSGFICGVTGSVPEEGEQFACESHGLRIQVESVKNHRIGKTMVTKVKGKTGK